MKTMLATETRLNQNKTDLINELIEKYNKNKNRDLIVCWTNDCETSF